ncbi:hypothetical protein [Campylobacter sp.]|uniref:hypothetical protein n=1 Tax=Campylobacter sp. TaxID=205 RepID=UPI002A53BD33|nr:hypothetical protein [Campylobacter sp.]MDD7091337.1 hypothetical protein [Campylobacteraceae bacterium]MDY5285911.1 hypothetical protein [Campylobacter sp.]
MLPLIIAGASAGVWYWLGNEQKRQNLDPEKVSRLDILKEMDKSDDISYISSLTKLSIKATKLNLEVIK